VKAAGTRGLVPGWIRVPVGEGSAPYLSVPFVRKVLIVARTVTTTEWLLDFLPEIFPDPRVQLLFTVEDEAPSGSVLLMLLFVGPNWVWQAHCDSD
jgi:hypothetical protein